jgi:hypothetical protein
MALRAAQDHRPLIRLYGQNVQVFSLAYTARILWRLRCPAQALGAGQGTLTVAHKVSHPFSLARAKCFAARLYQPRRDASRVQQDAEGLLPLATDRGFAR